MNETSGRIRDFIISRWKIMMLISALVYMVSLVLMLTIGSSWSAFTAVYGIWFISFLGILYLIWDGNRSSFLTSKKGYLVGASVVVLSLVLQILFLIREPSLSQDILRLVMRGEYMLDGQVPYRDFDVNKPPLYIWMVGGISYLFGSNVNSFRLIFIIFNSGIPLLMFLAGKVSDAGSAGDHARNWTVGAFAYALCPIPILEVGLAGHFDPVVVFFSLLAYIFFKKEKPFWAGALLGICFSLKIYGIVLLGIFFLASTRWRDRIIMPAAFVLCFVLSTVPLLFIDPGLVLDYFLYQTTDWYTGRGLKYVIESFLSFTGLPEVIASLTAYIILFGGSIFVIWGVLRRGFQRFHGYLIVATSIPLVGMGIFLCYEIYIVGTKGPLHVLSGIVFTGAVVVMASFVVRSLATWKRENGSAPMKIGPGSHIKEKDISITITALLFLLLMTSSQFHPWYLPWILPFLFTTRKEWMWTLLILFGMIQMINYTPVNMSGF